MQTTNPSKRRMWIGIGGMLLLATLAIGQVWRATQPRRVQGAGRITHLDLPARRATLEITHPKSGKTMELAGQMADDCVIRIDGRPARLEDLQVGEIIQVEALLYSGEKIVATSILARRAGPATPSANAGPKPPPAAPNQPADPGSKPPPAAPNQPAEPDPKPPPAGKP